MINKETLEALKQAVDKWKSIVEYKGMDFANRNCPLCIRFEDDCWYESELCPIASKEKEKQCGGTPYGNWILHQKYSHKSNPHDDGAKIHTGCDACEKYAREELEYLENILKEYQEKVDESDRIRAIS